MFVINGLQLLEGDKTGLFLFLLVGSDENALDLSGGEGTRFLGFIF